jgi:hypothetical protein
MNEVLKKSVDLMLSEDYKERVIAEHMQLKNRIEGLEGMLGKWNEGTLPFVPKSSKSTFEIQLKAMKLYLECLEDRMKDDEIKI